MHHNISIVVIIITLELHQHFQTLRESFKSLSVDDIGFYELLIWSMDQSRWRILVS